MGKTWTNTGFWLVLGLAAGMLVSDLTKVPTVSAAGSADRFEDFCMVTGLSFDTEIDLLWLLDYRGARLHCIMVDRQGRLSEMAKIDLLEQFDLKEGGRSRPHFMMVTGRFAVQGTDLLYLAEVSSGQLLCIAPPFGMGRRPGQVATPRVVDRFQFRPEGEIRNQ